MQKYLLLIVIIFSSQLALAQDSSMSSAYKAYKEIQKIIHTNDADKLIESRAELLSYVNSLQKSLHSFEEDNTQNKLAAFDENLEYLLSELATVERNLKNNSASGLWSVSRLKAISAHCQNCHTTYKVDVHFKDLDVPEKFNQFQRAEFLLASRQFKEAEASYWSYLTKGDYQQYGALHPLYRWIDLQVRVFENPKKAHSKLTYLINKELISGYEAAEAKQWIKTLKVWNDQGGEIYSDFSRNKQLIKELLNTEAFLASDLNIIQLLRASSGFHKLIARKNATDKEKSAALYYLGLIYINTPVLYIYELPEFYLKSCIKKYPGTEMAKKSFQLLKQYLRHANSGSGGDHMDSSTRLDLEKLHATAYGKS